MRIERCGGSAADATTIERDYQKNESERKTAVAETDEYISALESNLSKIKEIQTTSDLAKTTEGISNAVFK